MIIISQSGTLINFEQCQTIFTRPTYIEGEWQITAQLTSTKGKEQEPTCLAIYMCPTKDEANLIKEAIAAAYSKNERICDLRLFVKQIEAIRNKDAK